MKTISNQLLTNPFQKSYNKEKETHMNIIDPTNFTPQLTVTDLDPIPREELSKLNHDQLQSLKIRWWGLFISGNAGVQCCISKFHTIMDELSDDRIHPGQDPNHTHAGDLDLYISEDFIHATWKGKQIINSKERLFVPGAWMTEFESLHQQALDMRERMAQAAEDKLKNDLVDMLVAE